jgi:hypothetical protein
MLCADMLEVSWTDAGGRKHRSTALLEDISAHGACLQLEGELPLGTGVEIEHPKARMRGVVRYCVYREIGYFVGVEFSADCVWSQSTFKPEHMLDLEQLVLRSAGRPSKRVN